MDDMSILASPQQGVCDACTHFKIIFKLIKIYM